MDFDFDLDLKTDFLQDARRAAPSGKAVVLDDEQRYAVELCIARAELATFAEHVDVAAMTADQLWQHLLASDVALQQGDDVASTGRSPRQILADHGDVFKMPDLVFA